MCVYEVRCVCMCVRSGVCVCVRSGVCVCVRSAVWADCIIGRKVNTVLVSTRSTVAHLHNLESCLATKKKSVADFPVNFWCVYVLCRTSFFRA